MYIIFAAAKRPHSIDKKTNDDAGNIRDRQRYIIVEASTHHKRIQGKCNGCIAATDDYKFILRIQFSKKYVLLESV